MTSFDGVDGLELTEMPEPTPGDGEEVVNVRAASLGPWDLSAAGGAFTAIGGSGDFRKWRVWDFAGETADGRRVLGFVAQPWMGVGALAERIAVPFGDPGVACRTRSDSRPAARSRCARSPQSCWWTPRRGTTTTSCWSPAPPAWSADSRCSWRVAAARVSLRQCATPTPTRRAAWGRGRVRHRLPARGRGPRAMGGRCRRVHRHRRARRRRPGVRPRRRPVGDLGPDRVARSRSRDHDRDRAGPADAAATEELAGRAAAGELTARVADVLPFERYREAFERLQRGGLRGKLVLTP